MKFRYYVQSLIVVSFLMLQSCKKDSPVETPTNGTGKVTIPAAPSSLQIISLTENAAFLHWIDSSTAETSFEIEQGTDTSSFVTVKSVGANIDTATVPGIFLTSKTYFFRVKAKNSLYTSTASNVVQRSLFPPPANFMIVSFSSSTVSLSWNDNSTVETGFVIEQSIDSLSYVAIDSTAANGTSKTISGFFDSSKTYSFRILAKNSINKSGYSNAEARTLGNWVFVSGGTFLMGRNGEFRDERPIHNVVLSNYYISKYEVTVKDYRKFTTATNRTFPVPPSWGWNDDAPMVKVSWYDAKEYCTWLDSTSSKGVRLPTEAEWEYAARGGKNSQKFAYSGSNSVEEVAWYYFNASGRTYNSGLKKPNELGIFDMSGNAWEWCADWQGSYSSSIQRDPTGPATGNNKIFRGGSWFDYGLGSSECRVETRYDYTPGSKVDDGGFRIVRVP